MVNTIDITEETLPNDICFHLFSSQERIKSYLLDFLKDFWQSEFPFQTLPDVYKAIELNRFKGFSREFYHAIPYEKGTRKIAENFSEICNHLKRVDTFLKHIHSFKFPSTRRIKRAFFEKQWLFFFLDELEALYAAINNIDIFRELFFIPDEDLYCALSNIKVFPNSICFFRNFALCKKTEIPKLLNDYTQNFIAFSNCYALLSAEMKEKMISNY